jgi:hypothetical protein
MIASRPVATALSQAAKTSDRLGEGQSNGNSCDCLRRQEAGNKKDPIGVATY